MHLKSNKRVLFHFSDLTVAALGIEDTKLGAKMSDIFVFATGVDDKVDVIAASMNNAVINDSELENCVVTKHSEMKILTDLVVHNNRETGLVDSKGFHISNSYRLDKLQSILSSQTALET